MFVVYKLLHPYVLKNGPPRWQHLGLLSVYFSVFYCCNYCDSFHVPILFCISITRQHAKTANCPS